MDKNKLNRILTANEAAELAAANERWRSGHCVTIMHDTLSSIREIAISGGRQFVSEGIGEGVNLDAFSKELESLGYRVSQPVPADKRLPRSLRIEW